MSEAPELNEAEALAAEHALGVLSGAERAEAEARIARDPAFAADVEAWRGRLAPLIDTVAPVTPPAGVWSGIERLLPANDNAAERRVSFWRRATAGSFALAAASFAAMVFVANQPPTVIRESVPVAPQGQLLSASLAQTTGRAQPLFVASYDPDRKALIVTSLLPPGSDRDKVHELWLIAGQDKPKSLGLVESGKAKIIALPADVLGKMAEGSALAISEEAPGGSKNPDGPTGPVISVGKLSKL
jgi:anti-sigma-K factor RskA